MSETFDLEEGRALRDEGLQRVSTNAGDFMDKALAVVAALPAGDYKGESVRALVVEQGIVPHSSHAWGALIRTAILRGYLKLTGRFMPMASKKSHAHTTQVYAR